MPVVEIKPESYNQLRLTLGLFAGHSTYEVAKVPLKRLVSLNSAFEPTFGSEASPVSGLCFDSFNIIIMVFLFFLFRHSAASKTSPHSRSVAFEVS